MLPDLENLAAKAQSKKRDFKALAQRMKKLKPQKADEVFRQLHKEAFEHIDCLACANCCKGLGPRLTEADIARLASALKMKTAVFMDTYLRIDEDGDNVFQSMPCPFLPEDNYCVVYASRPRACRAYPHTDQKNIKSILSLCVRNTETCPAVYRIFENLPSQLP